MKNVEDALLRLVRSERKLRRIVWAFENAGFTEDSPISWTHGEIIDAIYELIGDESETYEESETFLILNTKSLSEEREVALLMDVYRRHVAPEMPAPNLISKDKLRNMQKQNGYMTPDGDWL